VKAGASIPGHRWVAALVALLLSATIAQTARAADEVTVTARCAPSDLET
jgi:hypothetical protein